MWTAAFSHLFLAGYFCLRLLWQFLGWTCWKPVSPKLCYRARSDQDDIGRWIYIYRHKYIYIYIHAYMHTCIHAYIYIYVYIYICIYIYIYIYIYIQRRICTYMYTCYANMYVQSALLKISAIKISGWPYLDPPLSFRLCFSVKTSCGKQVEIHSYLCTNRMCKALPVLRPLRFGCRCWPFFSLCFLESLTWSNLISWSEAWHR